MEKLKVGLDFDGVISDNLDLKTRVAKTLFEKDLPSHIWHDSSTVMKHIPATDYRALQQAIYNDRRFGLNMRQVPRAREFIERLQHEGWCELKVVSARFEGSAEIAREWMFLQKLNLPLVEVGYGVSKEYAAAGLDAFVDDDYKKLIELIGVVPCRYLFSWPYNESDSLVGIDGRVKYWSELYWILHKIHEDRLR